jgi:hypothetical protein
MGTNDSIDPAASADASQARTVAESPVLVHVWEMIDPQQADAAAQRLDEMLAEAASAPGFVSGRLLESADGHSVAVAVEMRTVEDRRRLEQLPAVRDTLAHLDGTLNLVVTLYRERARYPA